MDLQAIPPRYRQLLSPLKLAEANSKNWISTAHHKLIDRTVRRFLGSDLDLLIVTAPPRHGKSEYLARWFPTWYLGMHPQNNIMLCSYAASLAGRHNRWVRNQYHRLAKLFGNPGVQTGAAKAADWQTEEGGGSMSSGVQGGITGRGANLILIDDYCRSAKDAHSKTYRETVWEWFRETLSTRREPGAKIVVLATPWHHKDLIGELRANHDLMGMKMEWLQLQAIYDGEIEDPMGREVGEALWPERWPVEVLELQKRTMASYGWQAQYQGDPTLRGDTEWDIKLFRNIWLQDDEWPETPVVSAAVLDPSKGKTDRSDYQALVYVGYYQGNFIVDADIDRRSVTAMTRNMARRCLEWRPTITGIESNAFQDLLAPDYEAACHEVGYTAGSPELIDNTVPKEVRIRRLGQFIENHKIKFRRNRSTEMLIEQLQEFPNGEHDDGPDALEGAMRLLSVLANIRYGDPEDLIYSA